MVINHQADPPNLIAFVVFCFVWLIVSQLCGVFGVVCLVHWEPWFSHEHLGFAPWHPTKAIVISPGSKFLTTIGEYLSLGKFFFFFFYHRSGDVVSNMVRIKRRKDLEGRKVFSPLMENELWKWKPNYYHYKSNHRNFNVLYILLHASCVSPLISLIVLYCSTFYHEFLGRNSIACKEGTPVKLALIPYM